MRVVGRRGVQPHVPTRDWPDRGSSPTWRSRRRRSLRMGSSRSCRTLHEREVRRPAWFCRHGSRSSGASPACHGPERRSATFQYQMKVGVSAASLHPTEYTPLGMRIKPRHHPLSIQPSGDPTRVALRTGTGEHKILAMISWCYVSVRSQACFRIRGIISVDFPR